jgi:hypothetical protein
MKILQSLRLLALCLFTASALEAQTNVFPTSGNVGVGTTSPQAKLDVRGTQITFSDNANGATSGQFSIYGLSNTNKQLWLSLDTTNNYAGIQAFLQGTGSLPLALQPAGGNVGIGTNNPQAVLDVRGAIMAGSLSIADSTGVAYADNWIGTATNVGDGYRWLHIGGVTDGQNTARKRRAGVFGDIIYLSGNVGIGVINPDQKLSVNGAIAAQVGSGAGDVLYMGNDSKLVDINVANTVGLYGLADTTVGSLKLGSNGGSISGANGNIGIGTTNPTQKLSVNGTVRAKEVIVDTGWSDYVFDQSYTLKPLSEVEAYVKAEKHLPGIPSAQEVADHGISVGEMQSKLLAKVEELTLHVIEQEKRITAQQDEIIDLKNRLSGNSSPTN